MKTRLKIFIPIFILLTLGGIQVVITNLKDESWDSINIFYNFIMAEGFLVGIYLVIDKILNDRERKKIAVQHD